MLEQDQRVRVVDPDSMFVGATGTFVGWEGSPFREFATVDIDGGRGQYATLYPEEHLAPIKEAAATGRMGNSWGIQPLPPWEELKED